MRSFVIFKVIDQLFGIDIECVKRILPSQMLTDMPDEDDHIQGMFQYEDAIIKVLDFRHIIKKKSYEEQLKDMFPELIAQHKAWLDALSSSVNEGTEFLKTTDPHACELGKWIDSFHPENDAVVNTMKQLDFHHQRLHRSAVDILEERGKDLQKAKQFLEETTEETYRQTVEYITAISDMSEELASEMQRCLILIDKDDKSFGVNIDTVEDIVHIDDNRLNQVQNVQHMSEFMNVAGILEHEGKLITIVQDITIRKRSA